MDAQIGLGLSNPGNRQALRHTPGSPPHCKLPGTDTPLASLGKWRIGDSEKKQGLKENFRPCESETLKLTASDRQKRASKLPWH